MTKFVKTYADTYLYRKYPTYEEEIFKYLMNCQVIDKTSDNFKDAKYEIKKRAVSRAFIDCMESDNVIFVQGQISKPFLVITAKDLKQRATHEMAVNKMLEGAAKMVDTVVNAPVNNKDPGKTGITGKGKKVEDAKKEAIQSGGELIYDLNFIPFSPKPIILREDVAVNSPLKVFVNTNICMDSEGKLKEPEILISLLTTAIVNLMYYKMPEKLFNFSMLDFSSSCFVKLFTHVVDMMAKISVMDKVKPKCEYIACRYFYSNIACTYEHDQPISNFTQSVRAKCMRTTELSQREVDIIDSMLQDEDYTNIKTLIEGMANYLKLPALQIDNFVEKWMYLYGGPTCAFGLEYFPNFSNMITDAYHGCYLNNQKTIEKVCGNDMVGYTKELINQVQ